MAAAIGSYGAGDGNRLDKGAIILRERVTSPLFLCPLTDRDAWMIRR